MDAWRGVPLADLSDDDLDRAIEWCMPGTSASLINDPLSKLLAERWRRQAKSHGAKSHI